MEFTIAYHLSRTLASEILVSFDIFSARYIDRARQGYMLRVKLIVKLQDGGKYKLIQKIQIKALALYRDMIGMCSMRQLLLIISHRRIIHW
jgi:hypothetical protein